MTRNIWICAFLAFIAMTSCRSLNQNVMFKTEGKVISDTLLDAVTRVEKNYQIRKNDYLQVMVYTNKGERLVDPNQEMGKQLGSGDLNMTSKETPIKYLVESTGAVKLPLVGFVDVLGLSVHQLDSLLQVKFSEFYTDAYVVSKVLNKRVFVLGTAGNKGEVPGMVIPLENENMTLVEVLTLAGGLDQYGKSHNIRLIRGDLNKPNVYLIDLSTIEGVRKTHMNVQSNDIIYVERQRRIVSQFLTEATPLLMFVNTLLLIFIATRTRL